MMSRLRAAAVQSPADARDFPDGIDCGEDPEDVAAPAPSSARPTACRNSDSIRYDLDQLRQGLPHPARRPVRPLAGESINVETQAGCSAGAWTAWVVAGKAAHVAIRAPELDTIVTGYLT
jgi:hypothetical protein